MSIASFLASPVPILGAVGAVGIAALWAVRLPCLALGFLGFSVVAGQLVRLPLPGQGGGLLLSDVAVPLVLLAAFWHGRPFPAMARTVWWLLLPFLLWSIFSLALYSPNLAPCEVGIAAAYWVRLSSHLLLLPALLSLSGTTAHRRLLQQILLGVLASLALLGLLQVWLVPHLGVLGSGWDPHSYRLVATWLDPNFMGGLLAVVLPWLLALVATVRTPLRFVYLGLTGLVMGALLLTQSRSSLLAILGAALVLSPLFVITRLRPRPAALVRAGAALALGAVLLGLAGLILGPRAWGLVTFDPTVTLRLDALRAVWRLAIEHSLFGVGYNAYQFAAQEAGLIGDFTIHSRAGSDTSWLTLWVTTGITGIALWLLPWWWIGQRLARRVWRDGNLMALAGLVSLITWFIHSFFVNSLLYAHLIIVMLLMVNLVLTEPTRRDE